MFIGACALLVLVCAAMLHYWAVPSIDSLRPRLEAYLSERTGQVVRIGQIRAESTGLLPTFELSGVGVFDAQQKPVLSLERVQINITPRSLLALELDRLTIDAPTLEAGRDAAGEMTVAGFKTDLKASSSKVSDWIFSQREIIIRGGNINWTDAQPHFYKQSAPLPSAAFSKVYLHLKNGLRSHSIRLEATPPEAFGQSIEITAAFMQPLFEPHAGRWQAWTGSVEAQIKNTPNLASQLKVRMDWPVRNAEIAGELLQLDRLAKLAKSVGYSLPQEPAHKAALDALLTQRLAHFKLHALALGTEQLQIQLETALVSAPLTGDFAITWLKAGDKISATANFRRVDFSKLPRNLVGPIEAGIAHDVQMLARGALKDFPFVDTTTSELRMSGRVVDMTLTAPNELALKKARFYFTLNGANLDFQHINGEWAGLAAKGFVHVADWQNPVLELSAELNGSLANLLKIVNTAPLDTLTHRVFTASQAAGPMFTAINLTLPLAKPRNSKVVGQIQLQGNDFTLNAATPPLSRMTGTLYLTPTGVQLDDLHGAALGGEVKIWGGQQKIMGTGTASAKGLLAWPALPLRDYLAPHLQGATPYAWSLESRPGGAGLVIESSLLGLQMDLPAPFDKPAAMSWPLRIQKMKTSALQDQLLVSLSQRLAAKFVQGTSAGALTDTAPVRGSVLISSKPDGTPLAKDLLLPAQGILATLDANLLDLGAWSEVTRTSYPVDGTPASAKYMPDQLSIKIDDLKLANRHITQVGLEAKKVDRTWRINANASHLNGYAEYNTPSAKQAGELTLRFAKLAVPDASTQMPAELSLHTTPTNAPSIDLVVEDLEVLGKKLGRLELLASNQFSQGQLKGNFAQEWRVDKLDISNPDAHLKVSGVWHSGKDNGRVDNNNSRVDMRFNLDLANSGELLSRLGLKGAMKDGKGLLQGRAAWMGAPWEFDFATLVGQLKMETTQGQFLKIEPGAAGRLFNMLSLQALPRLLTLNFRDVVSEGFAFDNLDGDAQIKDGVLHLKTLQMKSVPAVVTMKGAVHLVNETQDLHALVRPNINTDGASLITTLINPVAGITAYFAQLILRRPVVEAATKEYSIQGTWQNPEITQLKQEHLQTAP